MKNSARVVTMFVVTSLAVEFVTPVIKNSLAADPLPHDRFTMLSNGKFERQIEPPSSEPIAPGDPLESKMKDTYALLPFDTGERLRYVITYLGIKGGTAELAVRQPVKWKNSASGWSHRFTAEAKSADWASWFITLHEALECITDSTNEFTPQRFYMNQIENKFLQSKIVTFLPAEKKISQRTKRKARDEKIEEFAFDKAQDAVGALYYFRQRLASGIIEKSFAFPVFTSEKTWQLSGQFVKREKIKVEGNEFDADLFELKTNFGAKLEQKGKIKLWVTHDTRAIPVLIEAEVLFGAVKLSLTDWEQGDADASRKRVFPKISTK